MNSTRSGEVICWNALKYPFQLVLNTTGTSGQLVYQFWWGEYSQSALKYLLVPVLVQYQCWKGRDAQSYCCYCQYQCSTSAGGLQWRGEYAQSALPAGGWLWPCLTICLQMSRCFSSCSWWWCLCWCAEDIATEDLAIAKSSVASSSGLLSSSSSKCIFPKRILAKCTPITHLLPFASSFRPH